MKNKYLNYVRLDVAQSHQLCHHNMADGFVCMEVMMMEHEPGRLDFLFEKKTVTATELRRQSSLLLRYVAVPGHIVFITRRGKPGCVMMSIETWACMSEDYGAVMASVEAASQEYREKRRADRRAKRNGTSYK